MLSFDQFTDALHEAGWRDDATRSAPRSSLSMMRWFQRAERLVKIKALRAQVAALTEQRDAAIREIGKTAQSMKGDITALTAQLDAAFAMSRCECGAEEACRNLARLRDALGKAREAMRTLSNKFMNSAAFQV